MLYFLHILTSGERLTDHHGGEYRDLAAARADAEQDARAIIAGELLAGRRPPLDWTVQIEDSNGSVAATIRFTDIIGLAGVPVPRTPDHPDLLARAREIARQAREAQNHVSRSLILLRDQIGRLTATVRALDYPRTE